MTRTATYAVGRRRWTLAAGLVAAGFALFATLAPGRAVAAPPPSPLELAGQVEASVTTQVDAAVTQANDVLAAAQPPPAPAAPSIRVSVQVPATPTIDGGDAPPIQAAVVVVVPAPGLAAPAPVATHGIVPSRPPAVAATKKRTTDTTPPRAARPPRTVAPFPRPDIGASIGSGAGRGSVAAAASAAKSGSDASSRRETPRARAPELPLPFGPTGPALPDSGAASPGGQGPGAGAPLLVLLAVLGGLTVFGIPILLRKVLWSDLWMPRLVALPPWRPG